KASRFRIPRARSFCNETKLGKVFKSHNDRQCHQTHSNCLSSSASSSAFSTSASGGGGGGGGGRGRGRGGSPPDFQFPATGPPGRDESKDNNNQDGDDPKRPQGLGHGRGKPLPSDPALPSYSAFMSAISSGSRSATGRGRGTVPPLSPSQSEPQHFGPPKKPVFFTKEDVPPSTTPIGDAGRNPPDGNLSSGTLSPMSGGAGRGKPPKQLPPSDKAVQENRHLRSPQPSRGGGVGSGRVSAEGSASPTPKLSREEAVVKAMGILSRHGASGERAQDGGRGGGGSRGRGRGRGRGPRGWRGRGRARDGFVQDAADDDYGAGLYLGDNADGEKLAKRIGAENMDKLVEAFEEMSGRVLPSPMDDAYLDALDTNYSIECEPEYMMEEFGTNPDIDEKPPIPLRDALEKMKPFLMAYEGIRSQQEWEEVVNETMKKVPIMKELVDYYSGPDRVTAKKQQEELERVAKTLPESAPASVKRFSERAVLSLQSNPGWGFDKKCQFMDKLVWEVSQQYK
ncbi:uncharacterized protein LOC127811911, partial [Diospyros lotus]|uniref:uncharacterized protein LOC127811911 n=1 Tax=Diospyros lotus TaxID=55363 RepID=UPI00224D6748